MSAGEGGDTVDPQTFDRLDELDRECERLDGLLEKLEKLRGTADDAMLDEVRRDYLSRRETFEAEAAPLRAEARRVRGRLEEAVEGCRRERDEAEKERQLLELRERIGEFVGDAEAQQRLQEARRRATAAADALEQAEAELDKVPAGGRGSSEAAGEPREDRKEPVDGAAASAPPAPPEPPEPAVGRGSTRSTGPEGRVPEEPAPSAEAEGDPTSDGQAASAGEDGADEEETGPVASPEPPPATPPPATPPPLPGSTVVVSPDMPASEGGTISAKIGEVEAVMARYAASASVDGEPNAPFPPETSVPKTPVPPTPGPAAASPAADGRWRGSQGWASSWGSEDQGSEDQGSEGQGSEGQGSEGQGSADKSLEEQAGGSRPAPPAGRPPAPARPSTLAPPPLDEPPMTAASRPFPLQPERDDEPAAAKPGLETIDDVGRRLAEESASRPRLLGATMAISRAHLQIPDMPTTLNRVVCLVSTDGDDVYYILEPRMTVGRQPMAGNQIVIDDAAISRQHAKIEQNVAGDFVLEDLGSSNGTFVNGDRIESHELELGDTVQFGPAGFVVRLLTDLAVEDAEGA